MGTSKPVSPEQQRLNNQLDVLDVHAIDELRHQLRDAQTHGYDFVEVAVVERALTALADLMGDARSPHVDTAIDFLEDGASDHARLLDVGSELSDSEGKLQEVSDELKEYKDTFKATDITEGILVTADEKTAITEVLEQAGTVLERVPGQRLLAQRAFERVDLLGEVESLHVIEVDPDSDLFEVIEPTNT